MQRLGKIYYDLDGNRIDLRPIDSEERELLERLDQYASEHSDATTGEFWNYSMAAVGGFYEKRGLERKAVLHTIPWRIAQDLNSRLMIAAGLARQGNYRDQLEALMLSRFGSRRAFCNATGISEDMLSHVLAKRKNLGIETLSDALAKIGYTISIVPMTDSSQSL